MADKTKDSSISPTLEEKLATAQSLLAAKEAENEQLLDINADLQKRLEAVKAAKVSGNLVIVEHEGIEYEVTAPKFKWRGQEYTAEELKQNEDLMDKLVDAGAGILKKVVSVSE